MTTLRTMPDKYPYTNAHGVVYTKETISELYTAMRKAIYFYKRNPDDYNVHIVKALMKHIQHFNPLSEDPKVISFRANKFAGYLITKHITNDYTNERKSQKAASRAKKKDPATTKVFYKEVYGSIDDLADLIKDAAAQNNITENLQLEDLVRFLLRDLGAYYVFVFKSLYEGSKMDEICLMYGVSKRTAARMRKKIVDSFNKYMTEEDNGH